MKSNLILRARLLSALFILAALLLASRLYFVQIVHGAEYRRSANAQYAQPSPDTEARGDIFFTKKDGSLVAAAVQEEGWRIAISPKDISDVEAAYATLSALTPIDRARFLASAAKKDDPYEEIAFRVTDGVATQIRAGKLSGVIPVRDEWRYYPAGSLASHTIGFVGYQGDRKVGVYGLEREWQDTLLKSSSGLYVNPFAELFTSIGSALTTDPAGESGSLITSIEPSVEQELEDVLAAVVRTHTPKEAGGIIMDPKTGEIIAISAKPDFDPNTYNISNPAVFGNPLVENVYEMGSIMKPLTVAAGLDVGAITPQMTYNDKGCIERSGKKICNYDGKARGVVSMQEVLNQSLNTGATFVAETMGRNVFGEYVHAYGLGEKTGVDLPSEARGIIHSIDRGYDVDYASASFGQGIAVTPMEMVRALSVLGNGGTLPPPHVVTGIRFESGITRAIEPAAGARVISEESAATVTAMLVKVFDDALLGGVLKQEHYSIAAKTGTAQIAIPGGGGYYADRYLHSFFGYFPAYDPKFIVFLFAVEPHGAEFASASLARPFLDITKFLINYYDIPPDR